MNDMNELILLSRKAANEWRNNDSYYQAAVLIDSLCDRLEDSIPVAQLREMLSNLERMCRGGDEGETYATGYRNGHHNGQIELLRYILQVPDGTSENESKGD